MNEGKQELNITCAEKQTLEKILEDLRADRNVVKKYREEKRKQSVELWDCFGALLQLDR